jgi:putative membrane protein insertion efficiency factor
MLFKFIRNFIILILIFPIKIYKYFISPLFPNTCRYIPSCSQYAIEAISKYGPIKGLFLAIKRIISCNPWGGNGFDPVP